MLGSFIYILWECCRHFLEINSFQAARFGGGVIWILSLKAFLNISLRTGANPVGVHKNLPNCFFRRGMCEHRDLCRAPGEHVGSLAFASRSEMVAVVLSTFSVSSPASPRALREGKS